MLQLSFVHFKQKSYIFVEGTQQADRFYIIQSGKVHVSREIEILPPVNGNYLGPGDFIGVIPCMCNHTQLETVIAITDVVLIAVERSQYPDLITKNVAVAMKIILSFSQKTRLLNKILAEHTAQQYLTSDAEHLYSCAAYYDTAGNPHAAAFSYYQYMKSSPQGENIETAKKRFLVLRERLGGITVEPKETVRTYTNNQMIFSEHQRGDDMFIIQEGQVAITKVIQNKEVILAVLKKGDFFGEMALLENQPRSASAIAHSDDCKLSVVNRLNFDNMVKTQAQLISRLTTTLADRLWSMYRQVANTFLPETQSKLFDMLALQLEKARPTGNQVELSITLKDLANMCGIPIQNQTDAIKNFKADHRIRVLGDNLFVTDCNDIIKAASQFRKKK